MAAETRQWETLDVIRERFIAEMAQNMEVYGISQTVGRLYGTIFFQCAPMTLDEMSEALGMSKTSMSNNIRLLSEADMVERVWEKGVRKDLYKDEEDWYKSFSSVFINRWKAATDANLKAAKDAIVELEQIHDNAEDPVIQEQTNSDLAKVRKAHAYYEWLNEVIFLFEDGTIFEYVPKRH
ncbi:transcriptional regulator [Salsuginibacillus halophilus]|uniref:HTH-type transcriptional regulator n=1 Tax=Salsuginibacillus halophilus TaxID=517424 RepID=A0A2P8HYN2_9BACI|nr:helix-turn-helix domain-containing protein [Salsuginibacillus halophilus]PSL51348.1 transcriptional regulator [Salsuginibacillus halophilus]